MIMKNFLLIILTLLSINVASQNRFTKEFEKADSVYRLSEVAKFDRVIEQIESDTTKVTITIKQCALLYFSGYINGSLNFRQKGGFDAGNLLQDIKDNQKSIRCFNRIQTQQ